MSFKKFNQDAKFIAIPGYEWSGNTGLGGDETYIFLLKANSSSFVARTSE